MKPIKSNKHRLCSPKSSLFWGIADCQNVKHLFRKKPTLMLLPLLFLSSLVYFSNCLADSPSKSSSDKKVYIVEKNDRNLEEDNPLEPANQRWIKALFSQDKKGILIDMENQVSEWDAQEEFVQQWNLESTGIYETPDKEEKIRYLRKNALKYLDSRISGEVEMAEAGSNLKKVGQVQKALRPNTEVPLSPSMKLKFKAQLLQGKATLLLQNPFFHWSAQVKTNGNLGVTMAKDLEELGVKTVVHFNGKDGTWEAVINKQLSDSISSSVSSSQDKENMAFTSNSDRKVEVHFHHPF